MSKASPPSTSPAAFPPRTRLERLLRWPVPRALTMICGLLAVGLDAQTFSTTELPVGSNPRDAVLADFDLDGDFIQDLVIVNSLSDDVTLGTNTLSPWVDLGQSHDGQAGTLVPMPTFFVALPVNTPLAFTWPAGVPAGVPAGTRLYLQGWYDTALGAGATTATNALRVIAQ